MSEFIKTGSKKSDVSILEQVRYCANWLTTPQEREKKKRNTALKGREERGEEKKRLTFPLVFISWSLEFTAIFALNGENFLDLVLINSDIYVLEIKCDK